MATRKKTSPAHTPGPSDHTPWTAERIGSGFDSGFYQVVNSRGWVIATRLVYEDAHLLATAPDLLERAESLLANWENGNISGYIQSLSAAVAKAKGRAAWRKADGAGPEWTDKLCRCPGFGPDAIFKPDDTCECGESKHHYHCTTCGGICQVG